MPGNNAENIRFAVLPLTQAIIPLLFLETRGLPAVMAEQIPLIILLTVVVNGFVPSLTRSHPLGLDLDLELLPALW